ncbi:MAG TPA: plastocyanin/azurin family copper-binding protein [Gemmatimonadaceae bacterium]
MLKSRVAVAFTVALALMPRLALAQGDTTITIKALSNTLEFVPASIAVKAGTRLHLRFVNEGTYPHNFVLPKKDDDIDDLAAAAMNAGESGFVPVAMKDKLIAYTGLISPGQVGELDIIVPAPGKYTYVCLFPGHSANMLGTLRSLK